MVQQAKKDILGKRASLAPQDQQQPSCQRLAKIQYIYRGTPNNKTFVIRKHMQCSYCSLLTARWILPGNNVETCSVVALQQSIH